MCPLGKASWLFFCQITEYLQGRAAQLVTHHVGKGDESLQISRFTNNEAVLAGVGGGLWKIWLEIGFPANIYLASFKVGAGPLFPLISDLVSFHTATT